MRRLLLLILVLLTACRGLSPAVFLPTSITPALTATQAVNAPVSTPLPPLSTQPPEAAPTSTPFLLTPIPLPLSPTTFTVQFHPEGAIFVGDQVSIEVISPPGADLKGKSVQVQIGGPQGVKLGPVSFGPFGLGDRSQATLLWAWDTRGFGEGHYELAFHILPDGSSWTETVVVQPANAMPYPGSQAHWTSAQSKCCIFYYVTGTAAERDIRKIMALADAQAADAAQRMGVSSNALIPITLLSRVLGNGGFTAQEISVSYLDRNYGGNEFAIVLHHEMIHVLDARLGGDLRPTLLEEGLAVFMSGGHFRQQPILADAAALLQIQDPLPAEADEGQRTPAPGITPSPSGSGWFLPLRPLADNFYASQHEIGYLEAAALVAYLVERWGWNGFNKFYRDIHAQSSGSQADAINASLLAHLGVSLDILQNDFLNRLRQEKVTPANLSGVKETVDYFDVMRQYQELLDPSAYFRTAWLLDNEQMRRRDITADYLRHPSAPDNLALETMLIAANQDWQAFDYSGEDHMLAAINAVLDGVEIRRPNPFGVDPLALAYQMIVNELLKAGYQPQLILVNGGTAQAWVTASGPLLIEVNVIRMGGTWIVQTGKGAALMESLSLSGLYKLY
jgi:hypothetical protein